MGELARHISHVVVGQDVLAAHLAGYAVAGIDVAGQDEQQHRDVLLLALLPQQRLLHVPGLGCGSGAEARALGPVHVALVIRRGTGRGLLRNISLGTADTSVSTTTSTSISVAATTSTGPTGRRVAHRCPYPAVVRLMRENAQAIEHQVHGSHLDDHAAEQHSVVGGQRHTI